MITVFGSINVDLVARVAALPGPEIGRAHV